MNAQIEAADHALQVQTIVDEYRAVQGALLPILHAIQDKIGYIPPDTISLIAQGLNLSRAEVHGVITYYHHFRQQPAGRHVVQLCRAESCQALGADALAEHAKEVLACDFHETTADGEFTLEPVYCLGQCACGPAMMIDDGVYGRVSNDKFNRLMDVKKGTP